MTPLTGPLPVRHGFFTRAGGVSTGAYASLNCSVSGGDDPAAVAENRERVRRHLNATVLVGVTQVHGPDVAIVTGPWDDRQQGGVSPRADAMVTAMPGVALGIVTADCTPVLLYAPGVVGAVHAGWRGAVAGVLEATIAAMRALAPGPIAAVIGPCIRQPSYEVTADLRDAVGHTEFFTEGRPGHWQFDLAGYCAARLAGCTVTILDADTAEAAYGTAGRFWSHRRRTLAGGGPIGHQISAIVL